ncbi:TPA: hypothetical protein ACUA8U_002443 [Escherichia coli]|jgi:hypothetical protein|uniref:hypothetical protein n=1 Tax=Escherichia coli TaxID=562 RepID=UPI0010CC0E91|nr:hypothetical protein [Escherichia coli]DAR54194.1 MAG TPA: hypothetical protein [Caudoviricetes sp.]EHL6317480.1 hypothetical protein [Escherichia coli]EIX4507396.1 hypothetical protein [Escherichia coli]GDH12346.1 hypothetical protein BvCmsKKNP019_04110 [Escherichia coli]HAX4891101.1 hypothetical protein [Escherichia coli]
MDVYEDLYLQTNSRTFYFLKSGVVYRSDDGVIMKEWLFKRKDLLDDLVFAGIFRKHPANLEEEMLIDEVLK